MLFEDDEEILERAHYWMMRWAIQMRRDRAEIESEMGFPAATSVGELAVTNYAVSEDDKEAYYERHESSQVAIVDAIMTDLRALIPWAYWAISRRHGLGSMGLTQYEDRVRGEGIPPGMYLSALEEVAPMMEARGLM